MWRRATQPPNHARRSGDLPVCEVTLNDIDTDKVHQWFLVLIIGQIDSLRETVWQCLVYVKLTLSVPKKPASVTYTLFRIKNFFNVT